MDDDGTRTTLGLAGILLIAALVLAVVGLVVSVLRGLLILAAVVLVAVAAWRWLRDRAGSGGA